jgi:uncharacterized protein (UPF0276 family)
MLSTTSVPKSHVHRAGIGLRAEHHAAFDRERPDVGFVEVHSENHFGRGGKPLHDLERARQHCRLSLHGVGMSLGSADPLNEAHLDRLAELVERFDPTWVSEHLCWSSFDGLYTNDLLPLPYTDEALAHVVARVQRVQERLRRTILVENVSSYVQYAASQMPEAQFIAEVARRSGCGILLDVNNVYVSARNHGFDAQAYLAAIPPAAVREIHLAGFVTREVDGAELLLDTHSAPVADAVWALYRDALRHCGPVPTLIEWDAELPPLHRLLAEARRADPIAAAQEEVAVSLRALAA